MACFTAGCLGQLRNKLDLARIFVGRDQLFTVDLKFDFQLLFGSNARSQDNPGFDDLAAERIGFAHDSSLQHRRMLEEGAFNLKGANPIT